VREQRSFRAESPDLRTFDALAVTREDELTEADTGVGAAVVAGSKALRRGFGHFWYRQRYRLTNHFQFTRPVF
jgi:hypothetical protein